MLLSFTAMAQTTTRMVLDKNSVVRDSDGGIIPYDIWTKLMQTSQYEIRPGQNGEFSILQLSPEQAARNAERRKAAMVNMPKPRPSDAFKEGEKFKGDRFTSINKVKFDLKQDPGKVYVFNFWFINCPPCKKEIPELNELVKRYEANKDVVFIGVALDGAYDLKNFLKEMPFNYHIVPDGRYYSDKYGVKGYPTHLIVGKDGLIKFSTVGLATNTIHWVDKVIAEQVNAAAPAKTAGD